MRFHKIRNVPIEVCTAEAKIAYNYAFNYLSIIQNVYNKCACDFQRCDAIRAGVKFIMENLSDNIKDKYNIDAIFCCLNAGLEKYINEKYHILTSYDDIGKIFQSNVATI